ncbi:MAG: 3'-5' exonuclease [Lachnospiraceae bacterium]|nr:3'-5' exonuclease [Lachnospiraceae bacterium]
MAFFCDNFTVVDIETTGLEPKQDKITEIAALRVEKGKIAGTFHTLVNPGRKLEERIRTLTGLSDEDLEKAPFIGEVIQDFLKFETTGCLLGHSILFDYSFLKRAAVNGGWEFERQGMDTLAISRKYLQSLESRSLPFLCSHFHIPHKAHRALSDVEATLQLYELLKEQFGQDKDAESVFVPKPLIYKIKKESPVTKKQIEQLNRFLSYHNLQSEYIIENMTRNEASRYLDRLISSYGRIPPRSAE